MSLAEIIFVNNKKISCDGSKTIDSSRSIVIPGHPKIYLNMGNKDYVICPYCNRHFTDKKPNHVTNISNSSL